MIGSVLVANRGEIAVRVIRAAQELGIRAVAVYSDADHAALHVRLADEAVHIGPAPAAESYLSVDRIIAAARQAGVEALHPGYGFLSENPALAMACEAAGIMFIGPPAEAMRLLGDKVQAKRAMAQAGIPVLPGYHGDDQSDATLIDVANSIGYPLLVKAAAGGGGRGMRRVDEPSDLPAALESARREALSAFGDDRLLLERLLEHARHIEVQVLCDSHGQIVHFGERECSVQRRHQKVIEEAPSPVVDEVLRARLGATAEQVMRVAGYRGAGTVELLLGSDGRFYFMEVNARLQVEHPVTEVAWGIDLVKEQFRIAAGEPLAKRSGGPSAHAIECRLYAEDPRREYRPSSGRLAVFQPPLGPAVRHDVGFEAGDEVPPYYDAMLGKVIAWGHDRASALSSMRWALAHFRVAGVTTNLEQLRWVVDHPEFAERGVTIDFLDRAWQPLADDATIPPAVLAVAAAHELVSGRSWRLGDQRRTFRFSSANEQVEVACWRRGATWEVVVDGSPGWAGSIAVDNGHPRRTKSGARVQRLAEWGVPPLHEGTERGHADGAPLEDIPATMELHVQPHSGDSLDATVTRTEDGLLVQTHHGDYRVRVALPPSASATGDRTSGPSADRVEAPMPGRIVRMHVAEGDQVRLNQPLVIMEAMKSEHTVAAPRDGRVLSLAVRPGDNVERGATLVELEE